MKRLRLRFKRPTESVLNMIIRISLGVVLLSLLFIIIFFRSGPSLMRLYEGDISLRDIYAPFDFTYTGDIDEDKMKEQERLLLKETPPIYEINPQIEETAKQDILFFFNQAREARKRELISDAERLEILKAASSLKLSDQVYLQFIKAENINYIEDGIKRIIDQSLKGGILNENDKDSLKKDGVKDIVVFNSSLGTKKKELLDTIPTPDGLIRKLEKDLPDYLPKDKRLREAALEVIRALISSNLLFNPDETQKYREELLAKIPKIYKKVAVKKNEIIISKGEKVTKRHLKMLMQQAEMREITGRFFYLIGIALLLIIFLLISVFHLRFYESRIFRDNRNLILISILVLFTAVITEAVVISPLSSYLIPLASATILIGILLDGHSAFIFSVIMSMFVGVVGGNNFGLMIVMFIGSSVGIYSVRRVRRRSKLLLAGFLVGVANFITIIALGLLNNLDFKLFLAEAGLGMINGLISFLFVIGLLPVFEYLFKIPTDISLLELSDLNHSLLKEMATKAPGTYHHSLIVGNLAEAACDAIGANSLLARVGAYYHDIGKIEKAEYFSENEPGPRNSRHENITPSMSALVIINHVKDGIERAHKYKLNQAIIDFITQHHGNGLIYYFYQRALEKAEDEKEINEVAFRYPGPRPQTKETAIVLLADSVEASSRTLNNPTPSRVQGLVERIVNNKFIDGQLNDCDLTLKDLHKISEGFVRILNAMFHTRVEYPKEDESHREKNNHKESNKKSDSEGELNKGDNKKSI